MIKYADINISNVFTEGFQASTPSAMSLAVTAGSFTKFDSSAEANSDEMRINTRNFPAFEFDLAADEELDVVYDVYLLQVEGDVVPIHIDRTVIGYETMAIYEGDNTPLHCLLSITLPPKTTSLQNVEVTVKNIVKPKEATPNENPTE